MSEEQKIYLESLITKHEISAKTLLAVISDDESSEDMVERALACRRFVTAFISDLKRLRTNP